MEERSIDTGEADTDQIRDVTTPTKPRSTVHDVGVYIIEVKDANPQLKNLISNRQRFARTVSGHVGTRAQVHVRDVRLRYELHQCHPDQIQKTM